MAKGPKARSARSTAPTLIRSALIAFMAATSQAQAEGDQAVLAGTDGYGLRLCHYLIVSSRVRDRHQALSDTDQYRDGSRIIERSEPKAS